MDHAGADGSRARAQPLVASVLPPTLVTEQQSGTVDLLHSADLVRNEREAKTIRLGASEPPDHRNRSCRGERALRLKEYPSSSASQTGERRCPGLPALAPRDKRGEREPPVDNPRAPSWSRSEHRSAITLGRKPPRRVRKRCRSSSRLSGKRCRPVASRPFAHAPELHSLQ
jgi:hypothetical protein